MAFRSLVQFYVRHLATLRSLPSELRDPDELLRTMAPGKRFELRVPTMLSRTYNDEIGVLRDTVKAANPNPATFSIISTLFFTVRCACVVNALFRPHDLLTTFVLSCAQFLAAPYSLFVAVTQLIALFPAVFAGHWIVFFPLRWASEMLVPAWLRETLSVSIGTPFILLFFAIDAIICVMCVWYIPGKGTAARLPASRVLASVVYGFLNCKTYFLVLLLHSRGTRIDGCVWLIDAIFQLSPRAARWVCRSTLHWAALFYHQHRLAHLPLVYEHAHKAHHYLHDATAFDAHIYGSGAPEEWAILWMELLAGGVLRITPPSLSAYVLYLSYTNKIGHSRAQHAVGGNNAHVDHHTHHNKNYGIYSMLLDMYFDTCTDNARYEYGACMITKTLSEDGAAAVFTFQPK